VIAVGEYVAHLKFRLSGDYNPLHLDPKVAAIGGFKQPILHGLCFYGIATKHLVDTYGPVKDIKARFAGSVFPGETLEISSWKENDKVIFCKCRLELLHKSADACQQLPSVSNEAPSSSATQLSLWLDPNRICMAGASTGSSSAAQIGS
jgi:hypothetical protein